MPPTVPHDAEHFVALGVEHVLSSARAHSEQVPDVAFVLDALLTHPGRTGRLSSLAVAAGLATKEQADRVRAADCFAALVVPGRIPPTELADAMAMLAPAVPVQRWAGSLGDAAEAAPDAREAVAEILIDLLPRLDRSVRGLSALLDRLDEELARLGRTRATNQAFHVWASEFSGSSRAARTARRLAGI